MTNLNIGVTIPILLNKTVSWQSNAIQIIRERGHLDHCFAGRSPALPSRKRKAKHYGIKRFGQSTSVRRNRINDGSHSIYPTDTKVNKYKSCVDHYMARSTHPGCAIASRSFDYAQDDIPHAQDDIPHAQDDAATLRPFDDNTSLLFRTQ